MIFPIHTVAAAARKLDLQIAINEDGEDRMRFLPPRRQAQGPDLILILCTDREFVDVEARTENGCILLQLLSEREPK